MNEELMKKYPLSDKDIKLLALAKANEKYKRKTYILLFPSGVVILIGFLFSLTSILLLGTVLVLTALFTLNITISKEAKKQEKLILKEIESKNNSATKD